MGGFLLEAMKSKAASKSGGVVGGGGGEAGAAEGAEGATATEGATAADAASADTPQYGVSQPTNGDFSNVGTSTAVDAPENFQKKKNWGERAQGFGQGVGDFAKGAHGQQIGTVQTNFQPQQVQQQGDLSANPQFSGLIDYLKQQGK